LVTLPEYPASIRREIILSTSSTCPAPPPTMLLREIVAVSALPGERSLPPGEAGGDVAKLPGPLAPGTPSVEGGGDEPMSDDRRPEPRGEAAMVLVVGTFGLKPPELDRTDPFPSYGLFARPRDEPRPAAEDKLDTLPCFSGPLPLDPRFPPPVPIPAPLGEAGPTSIGALPARPPDAAPGD
jgi:hypothetical protein